MESLLSGSKLSEELAFFKQQAENLATQKLKYSNLHVPSGVLARKPTVANIPVCEPPAASSEESSTGIETYSILIKSTKPPLQFKLSNVPSTSSISSLKQLLSKQESTAPKPEDQRWIIKGKAMGDAKLLREFDAVVKGVEGETVVNLMIKASSTSTPITSTPAEEIPFVTLSTPPTLSISTSIPTPISLSVDPYSSSINKSTLSHSSAFLTTISSPELWVETYDLLLKHCSTNGGKGGEEDAKKLFEIWLGASLEFLTPEQKAAIREKTGVSAMGM